MKTKITRRSFMKALVATVVAPSLLPNPTKDPIREKAAEIMNLLPADHFMFTPKQDNEYGYGFAVHTDILYGISRPPYPVLVGDVTA